MKAKKDKAQKQSASQNQDSHRAPGIDNNQPQALGSSLQPQQIEIHANDDPCCLAKYTTSVRVEPPVIMDLDEGSQFLGISVRKLRYDIASRKIPAVRLGRRILLRRDALLAALAKLETSIV